MIYLSGPMTGLPDFNRPAFDRAAETLRSKGYEVWSPAEAFDRNVIMPRSYYMKEDIKALLECDTVMMLPDWESSRGARLEFEIAKELELPVLLLSADGEKAELLHGE
jgi:nucleoside 2-deoxyribosyltransferase